MRPRLLQRFRTVTDQRVVTGAYDDWGNKVRLLLQCNVKVAKLPPHPSPLTMRVELKTLTSVRDTAQTIQFTTHDVLRLYDTVVDAVWTSKAFLGLRLSSKAAVVDLEVGRSKEH